MPALPFKLNQDRRRHIPEQKRKVVNWREYDESLRRRGSLTVWFSDEVIEAWKASPRTGRGGRPEYSDLAILTGLTLKAVFRLAYRQTEGLIGSVIGLLGLDLAVPDHSTLCRRAETLEVPRPKPRGAGAGADAAAGGADDGAGPLHLLVDSTGLKLVGAGEWLVEKHGTKGAGPGRSSTSAGADAICRRRWPSGALPRGRSWSAACCAAWASACGPALTRRRPHVWRSAPSSLAT